MPPPRPDRGRTRALVAFGLVALPAVGSVFVLPAVAGAAGPDAVRLGAGLPVAAPVAVAGDVPARALGSAVDEETAATAFSDAGRHHDDAVAFARAWGSAEPYDAKVRAGRVLQAGGELPPPRD